MKAKPLHLIPGAQITAQTEKLAPGKAPEDIELEELPGGPVKGEWHRYKKSEPGRTILYLHGGGYYFGSAKSYRQFTFGLAREARANVFSLDYRLSEQAPYPAALDDAVTAYRWLLDCGVSPQNLIISGDSAGGGLTLALLLKLQHKGLPLPAGMVLLSPWTDLTSSGGSLDENARTDVMFKREMIEATAKKYYGRVYPEDPFVSPLFADLSGLPPALIFVSQAEMLRDDALRLHERLLSAGAKSQLIAEAGLAHVWPIFYGWIPEAKKAMRQIVGFLDETLQASRKAREAQAEGEAL